MSSASDAQPRYADAGRVGLIALFVTALVTAQIVSAKQLMVALPFTLPLVGPFLAFPGGTLAYAFTFFASDCISELYGKRFARTVVNVGFFMNFVMLALVLLTVSWGHAPFPGMEQFSEKFRTVLTPAANIVLGSLFAYVVSQNWDVVAFHWIRERTGPGYLWVRNVGSTMTSQFVDTVIFTVVAFAVAPAILGFGRGYGAAAIVGIIASQYLVKLLIALVDTPLVYATVGFLRAREGDSFAGSLAD